MKKLLRILKNLFNRYEPIKEIELSTGIICVHKFDTWQQVVRITIKKN